MKKKLCAILILLYLSASCFSAQPATIRVAVLENLMSQKFSSSAYAKQYLMGLAIAKDYAKKQGINIVYGHFFYDSKPLSILNKIEMMKAWNPDVVLGPRLSDNFLILQYYLKDILVLSPLASADAVNNMPNNFYSFSPTDRDTAKAMLQFLTDKYPKAKYFNLVESDCKSCTDISNDFVSIYQKEHMGKQIIQQHYISDQVKTIDIKKLLKGYQPGDIIILPSSSYSAGILIPKIINYLNEDSVTFMGGDDWGSGIVNHVVRLSTYKTFTAYGITSYVDTKNKAYQKFLKLYHQSYNGISTPSMIAYRSYHAIAAILNLELDTENKPSVNDSNRQLLSLYKFRKFEVYQINRNSEKKVYVTG